MSALACQELVELVTDYLEGSLKGRARRRFEKHLSVCDGCERYVAQMRQTLEALGTVPTDSLSAEAESTLLDAFRDFHR